MRIGYPCVNLSLKCTSSRTFRLASYSQQRLIETVRENLVCLEATLLYNLAHNILFFRITSDLVPFASHPICTFPWQMHFRSDLQRLGKLIRKQGIRVSMHPDQFTLINSPKEDVVHRSVAELHYHCELLDLMGLGSEAKVLIHVGGVYGDRAASLRRFVENYKALDPMIKRRLAIENDERCYPLADCLKLHVKTGVPVVLDVFHHELLHHGEDVKTAMRLASSTWGRRDGLPIVHFSTQKRGARRGAHAASVNLRRFGSLLRETQGMDFDLMLEVKDKEQSALRALRAAVHDSRVGVGMRGVR